MSDIVIANPIPTSALPTISASDLETLFDTVRQDSQNQRTEKTPEAKSNKGRGKKHFKGRGGGTYSYINRMDAMEWLDKHYPGWSFEVDPASYFQLADHIYVAATLKVIHPKTGIPRVIKTIGCDAAEYKKDANGNQTKDLAVLQYVKAAETDALKRAVFTLGGYADVYSEFEYEGNFETIELSPEDVLDYFTNILPVSVERLKGNPYALFKQVKMVHEKGLIALQKLKTTYNIQ